MNDRHDHDDYNDEECAAYRSLMSRAYTAGELLDTALPELKYVVRGLIPEGLTILAANPKAGKSFFALNVCIAVASGSGTIAGEFACAQGNVLYYALEDNPSRIKARMKNVACGIGVDDGQIRDTLCFQHECKRMAAGGLEELEDYVDSWDCALVVVDTLAGFVGERRASKNVFFDDYELIRELQRVAAKRRIAIILVHHTNKDSEKMPLQQVSGSHGITAAADTVLVMQKEGTTTVLYVAGKDVESAEHRLVFDKTYGVWSVEGKNSKMGGTPWQRQIMEFVETYSVRGAFVHEVNERFTDHNPISIRQELKRMADKGLLERVENGRYRVEGLVGL